MKKETFKQNKKGIWSFVKSPVLDHSFFAWKDKDYVWCSLRHSKVETYKNRFWIESFPKHRYDAHVFLHNAFGVFAESSQVNDRVAFLARIADGLHRVIEQALVSQGFQVIEPDPGRYDKTSQGRAKPDLGFKVYRQNGKFNPFTHQYEYSEELQHNQDYPGYEVKDDIALERFMKIALWEYAVQKAKTDDEFLKNVIVHGMSNSSIGCELEN